MKTTNRFRINQKICILRTERFEMGRYSSHTFIKHLVLVELDPKNNT